MAEQPVDHISVRTIAWVLAGLALVVVAVVGLMRLLILGLGGIPAPPPSTLPDQAFTGPRLSVHSTGEVQAYGREKLPLLHGWSWLDRERTTARIPVDEAMSVLERQGWPGEAKP